MIKKFNQTDTQYAISRNVVSYAQFYKDCCIKNNTKINNNIMYGLKNDDLIVNLDNITIADVPIFNNVLQNCKFQTIRLCGWQNYDKSTNNNDNKKITKKQRQTNNKIQLKKGEQSKEKILFTQQSQFLPVMNNIQLNLCRSNDTQQLILSNLHFSKEQLELLAKGISQNTSLKELYINNCGLSSNDFEKLSGAISNNSSLFLIDLSHNFLANSAGRLIGKILSNHCQRRDDIIWMYSLRGEDPQEDITLKGICEVNLAYNQLNTACAKDLCYFLQYDSWTRSINLKGNDIDEQGINEIDRILDTNQNLISLDLRENPGFNKAFSQSIFSKLLKNIKKFKKKRMEQMYQWQNEQQQQEEVFDDQKNIQVFENQIDQQQEELAQNQDIQEEQVNDQFPYNDNQYLKYHKQNQQAFQQTKQQQIQFQQQLAERQKNNLQICPEENDYEDEQGQEQGEEDQEEQKEEINEEDQQQLSQQELQQQMENEEEQDFNQQVEEDIEEDDQQRKVSHSLQINNNQQDPQQQINFVCQKCREYETKFMKSEYNNVNLIMENKKLKNALNNAMRNPSWSAIQPNVNEEGQMTPNINQPESSLNIGKIQPQQGEPNNESEEMLNRIENLMSELTRMMDNLENMQNNVTNNYTYQMSNTTNPNNNTYQILNSGNNNTFTNILGAQSNNNSNIIPSNNGAIINNKLKESQNNNYIVVEGQQQQLLQQQQLYQSDQLQQQQDKKKEKGKNQSFNNQKQNKNQVQSDIRQNNEKFDNQGVSHFSLQEQSQQQQFNI